MKLIHRLARFLAPNSIHQQLYPPPSVEFRIRPYEERDRQALIECYELNAPNRFPPGHRPVFDAFLDSDHRSFFVAESSTAGAIAFGGVVATSEQTHTLCYGLVFPKYQGCGVGATMALARMAFATRSRAANFSVILAVHKSIGYYQRFGFKVVGQWKGCDQVKYPIGLLAYPAWWMDRIGGVLRKRGHLIDPTLPLQEDEKVRAVLTRVCPDRYAFKFLPRFACEEDAVDEEKAQSNPG